MNVKFILFSVASLGSLVMMYMWFTMNRSVSNSQLLGEQYGYRISSLKSEIDFEKRLMESLRKDSKSYGKSYQEKSMLLETYKQKDISNQKDKHKLEQDTQLLNIDYDKVMKSNEEQLKKMKADAEAKQLLDNQEIENLTNELRRLETERDDLLKRQGKSAHNADQGGPAIIDKSVDNMMQGKAPKINKIKLKSKEEIENNKLIDSKNNNPDTLENGRIANPLTQNINNVKEKQNIISNKLNKDPDMQRMKAIKTENSEGNKAKINNKVIKAKESHGKNDKESDSQLEPPAHNVKPGNQDDDVIIKDDLNNKVQHNPKLLPRKDVQQINPPHAAHDNLKGNAIGVTNSKDQRIKPKQDDDNNPAIYQVKPPKKEDQQRPQLLQEKRRNGKFFNKFPMANDDKRDI